MSYPTHRYQSVSLFRKTVLALAVGMALANPSIGSADTTGVTTPSSAQLSADFVPGLRCVATAMCEIGLSPLLKLKMPTNAIQNPGNPHSIELVGDIIVVTPSLELPLLEAKLVVSIDPTGRRPSELYGTARAPMERLPLLKDADLETVPSMTVGLVQPETITQLLGDELPLNSSVGADGSVRESITPYFLFHVDIGLSMAIDLGPDTKAGTSLSLKVPGSESATFILDSVDPYFYLAKGLSLTMPKDGLYEQYMVVTYEVLNDDGTLKNTIHEHYDDNGMLVNKYTINATTGGMIENHYAADGQVTVTFFEPADKDVYRQEGSDGKNGRIIAQVEVTEGRRSKIKNDRADDDGDDGKDGDNKDESSSDFPIEAFGYSHNGWIGYKAKNVFGLPEEARGFAGQLFLQGSIPFGKFVSLDGDVVTYAGQEGFAQGGNGVLSLGLPGLPDFIDFSLELGNASAALVIAGDRQMTYVSGQLEPDTLFFDDILPIFPSAGAQASGYIDNTLGDAHLSITGEMGLGADVLGNWIGVDLNSLQMATATATIDSQGIIVSGMTRAQIHPAIKLSAEVYVEASIDWVSPDNASLTMRGDMDVFGVGLDDVTVSLSKSGMFINGAFVTPLTRIALAGEISSQGPVLSGSAGVSLGLGGITQGMQDAAAALNAAQTEVARLQGLITQARAVVNAERQRDADRLRDAQAGVTSAQNAVNSLNGKISYEYSRISKRKAEIASWNRWRKKAKWYQVAYRNGKYAYEAGWRNAEIAARYTTIGTLKVSLVAANGALAAANGVLKLVQGAIAVIPVDADPRVAGLITAKAAATVILEAAKLPFKSVPIIEGDFEGLIGATLDYRGIRGTVSAEFSGYSLLSGTVNFGLKPQACIAVPTFGNACTPI